jgi:hypothetical protein
LPTRKPRPKKPKELFFANARRKIERNTENRNTKKKSILGILKRGNEKSNKYI